MQRVSSPLLRRRILMLAAATMLLAALLVTFIQGSASRAADQALDKLLSAAALSIAGAVLVEDVAVAVEIPFAAVAMVSGEEQLFYVALGHRSRSMTSRAAAAAICWCRRVSRFRRNSGGWRLAVAFGSVQAPLSDSSA